MFARSIGQPRAVRAPAANPTRGARSNARVARTPALGDARSVFTTSAVFANAVERPRDVRAHGARRPTVMAAKVAGYIKLAIEAGKASPAPPIGPALGAKVRAKISFDAVAAFGDSRTVARDGKARERARGA